MLIGSGNRLLKSFCFSDYIYLGDPLNTVRIFSQKSIDELVILFIDKKGITSKLDYIAKLMLEATFPISVGGGISSLEDCIALNRLGVEKFVLTSHFKNQNLIGSTAKEFGAQATSVCFNYSFSQNKLEPKANYFSCRESLTKEAIWAQSEGAGEIIIQDIDRDGARIGYDLETIRYVSKHLHIQVVAAGGGANSNDMKIAINHGATAVAGSSMFFLRKSRSDILIRYPSQDRISNV